MGFENLFDDEGNRQYHRGPNLLHGGNQNPRRRRFIQIVNTASAHHRNDESNRTFIGVGQRQHRKQAVSGFHGLKPGCYPGVQNQIFVAQHHAFGHPRGARCINQGGGVVLMDFFADQPHGFQGFIAQLLKLFQRFVDDAANQVDGRLDFQRLKVIQGHQGDPGFQIGIADFVILSAGHKDHLRLAVTQDVQDLVHVKIRENRNHNRAHGRDGQIGNSPVRHVLAEDGNLVAFHNSLFTHHADHAINLFAQFGIADGLTVHIGQRGILTKLLARMVYHAFEGHFEGSVHIFSI